MHPTFKWLFSALLSSGAAAQEGQGGLFGFFAGRNIDYWNEGRMVQDPLAVRVPDPSRGTVENAPPPGDFFSGSSVVRAADALPFTWSRYEDARLAEFWDDGGDWIPPRPFREAASNPSADNIHRYLAWQKRKAQVTQRFQQALVKQDQAALAHEWNLPWKQIQVTYFYQSMCSHCQASKGFVEDLQRKGVSFTFVQLDYGQNPPLHDPSVPYGGSLAQRFPIEATPTWVVRIGSRSLTHVGEISLKKLFDMAASLINEEGKT